MQSSGVTGSRTLRFDLASPAQRQALYSRLTEGQSVEARVLDELPDGRWALRLMGQTLSAEAHQTLLSGQLVHARVESLGPPLVLSLTGGLVAEDAALGRALRDLHLPYDLLHRTILRHLMARGVPVTRAALQSLHEHLSSLSAGTNASIAELEQQLAAILMLRGRGIPVTPDAVAGYLGALPSGQLGGLLASLAGLLSGFRQRPGTSGIKPAADAAASLLSQLSLTADDLDGDAVQTLLQRLGIDLEGQMASSLSSDQPDIGRLSGTLRPTLLSLIAQLETTDANNLPPGDRTALESLLNGARDLAIHLNTSQAINLPSKDSDGFHLQIPLLIDGAVTTIDVRITDGDGGGGRPIDPDNAMVFVDVALSGLGPIHIGLSVSERRASCTIRVDDDSKTLFLRDSEDDLRQTLQACGFAVASVAVQSRIDEQAPDVLPRTLGIDVRA